MLPQPSPSRTDFPDRTDSFADGYQLSPSGNTPYATLPPALAGGGAPPFPDVATAKSIENGLPRSDRQLCGRVSTEPFGESAVRDSAARAGWRRAAAVPRCCHSQVHRERTSQIGPTALRTGIN